MDGPEDQGQSGNEAAEGGSDWGSDSCFHFLVPMFLSFFLFASGQENVDK